MQELRALLIESFDLEELHDLCFDLGINFDNLAGSTIDDDSSVHDAQMLSEAIKIVLKADEQLFLTSSSFYHDVIAGPRSMANMVGLPQPSFACITFVDLAMNSQIEGKIEEVRSAAPTAIFILYTTPAEYEQCLQTLSPEWATNFGHYYKLFKKDGLQLATDVRKLLDEARVTALRKMEMQLIEEQL